LIEIVFHLFRCNGKETLRADQIPRTIFMIVPVNERRKELVVHTSAPPFSELLTQIMPLGFLRIRVRIPVMSESGFMDQLIFYELHREIHPVAE
jgi:hypothetical protein